jgi:hypothetical protein
MTKSVGIRWWSAVAAVAALLALNGCSTGTNAMVTSLQRAVLPAPSVDAFPLDPTFRYIRTTHGGHVGFAWLGHIEQTPEGPVEVYYSSSGEVLRINAGRIVGASGFKTEWRRVSVPQPSWAAIAGGGAPTPLTRVRDVMPGYRFGVQDDLVVRVIPAPAKSALRGVPAESLTWFTEHIASSSANSIRRTVLGSSASDTWLPPARYAVNLTGGSEQVIYGEQCLSADLCLTWQRWSAEMQQPLKAASEKK